MTHSVADIMKEVEDIFKDVLGRDTVHLDASTTAADVEDWDSLTHIQLVVAIEKHFKVKFTAAQIQSWKNVGAMCEALHEKLSGAH
jgi:acyl carrier protein